MRLLYQPLKRPKRIALKTSSKEKIEFENESEQVLNQSKISKFAKNFKIFMKMEKEANFKDDSKSLQVECFNCGGKDTCFPLKKIRKPCDLE